MRVVVTGSSGHLGEALVRMLAGAGDDVIGLDRRDGPFTSRVGSIGDRTVLREFMQGAGAVVHAATLHQPHIATQPAQAFIDTNVTGTLALLEESAEAGVGSFVFVSTTSAFGRALAPPAGAPAAWITEDTVDQPKNIYGATKHAAEDLCELIHRDRHLPVIVLRTSRFFPEDDDAPADREIDSENLKVNELLHRRVDIEDAVSACRAAIERAPGIGFGRYVVSATSPFQPADLDQLRTDPASVVRRVCPGYEPVYAARGWHITPSIDRVYVNEKARRDLGWRPVWDFARAVDRVAGGHAPRSDLALTIGSKGYHGD